MRTIWVRVKNHIDLLCKQLQFCVCESASLETCIMLTLEICISAARMVHFSSRQCMTINQWDADCFYQMTTICITHDMKVFFYLFFFACSIRIDYYSIAPKLLSDTPVPLFDNQST